MNDKHLPGWHVKRTDPSGQTIDVRVSADTRQIHNGRAHINFLTEELYLIRTIEQHISQCTRHLITHKEHGGIASPQVMLQMMTDTSGFTHTGGGNNHLRPGIKIDHFGLIAGDSHLQAFKPNRVDSLLDQFPRLLIEALKDVLVKNICCFHRQRAVNINLKIREFRQQALRLDASHIVEHLLGSPHRKSRDHEISSLGKGCIHHLCQFYRVIRRHLMGTIPIGRLHDHIIRILYVFRILDERPVSITDIAGKYQFSGLRFLSLFTLRNPHLDGG